MERSHLSGYNAPVYKRPWGHPDKGIRQYEIGRRGAGCPVTVLADDKSMHVNWRDGKFKTLDELLEMMDLLYAAVHVMQAENDEHGNATPLPRSTGS